MPQAAMPMGATTRIESVDLVRGLIIIVMALDHVRDFFGDLAADPTALATTTAGLFFTRWITHFCAPVFAFTAGLGAFFWQQHGRTPAQLSRFLATARAASCCFHPRPWVAHSNSSRLTTALAFRWSISLGSLWSPSPDLSAAGTQTSNNAAATSGGSPTSDHRRPTRLNQRNRSEILPRNSSFPPKP